MRFQGTARLFLKHMNYQTIQNNFLASTYPNRGITFVRGKGSYLYDENGKEYLDMLGGSYGVNILGYGIPNITHALAKQIEHLTVLHSSFPNDMRSKATLKLVKCFRQSGFTNLRRVYWSNSGAESIEAAIKFAILHTKKQTLIAAKNSYHGKKFGALSVNNSGNGKYQKPFKNILLPVDWVDFGSIESLERVISSNHAAVILEPIQGEGGVVVPPPDYFPKVYALCKKFKVPLIIDEVQTGLGRTGTFFNSERYVANGFNCDIICLGKGLAYGLPVGATAISDDINSSLTKGIHTSTLGGNPLSMAGVYETLNYFEHNQNLLHGVVAKSNYMFAELEKLKKISSIMSGISGTGLMVGIELTVNPMEILKKLQDKGIIAAPTSTNRIRFLPALTIQKKSLKIALQSLREVVLSYT